VLVRAVPRLADVRRVYNCTIRIISRAGVRKVGLSWVAFPSCGARARQPTWTRANAAQGGARHAMPEPCDYCGSTEKNSRLCSKCNTRRFCSQDCLKAAWKAGHKAECAKLVELAALGASLGEEYGEEEAEWGGGTLGGEEEERCVVCDNRVAADHRRGTVTGPTLACGHSYCSPCADDLRMRCWMVSGQADLSLAGEGSKCLECRQEVDEAAAEADECEDMENVSARECFEAGMLLELGALRMLEEKGGKWEEVYTHRSGRLHFCFKEIFEDMEDARQRYSDAALDYGHAPSQFALGMINYTGAGLESVDYGRAGELFKQAAAGGHIGAKGQLAKMYRLGQGHAWDRDLAVARSLFEEAAHAGDQESQYQLGCMYRDGEGGKKADMAKAVDMWKSAIAHERGGELAVQATIELAHAYAKGKGVAQDTKQASGLYKSAIKKGAGVEAQYGLAEIYCDAKDYRNGIKWLEVSQAF